MAFNVMFSYMSYKVMYVMFLCRPALLECWGQLLGVLRLGWGRILGYHGVLFLRWLGSCLWVLVLWPLRGVWGPGGPIFCPLVISLFSVSWRLICLSLLFVSLSNTLKLWGLAFWSLSQGVGSVMGRLGLFFFFSVLVILHLHLLSCRTLW